MLEFVAKIMESGHVLLYDQYDQCHGQFEDVHACQLYAESLNSSICGADVPGGDHLTVN